MNKGICCAGNMIVDITYPIETWPKQNELTHITEGITQSTGGAVCAIVVGMGLVMITRSTRQLKKMRNNNSET